MKRTPGWYDGTVARRDQDVHHIEGDTTVGWKCTRCGIQWEADLDDKTTDITRAHLENGLGPCYWRGES